MKITTSTIFLGIGVLVFALSIITTNFQTTKAEIKSTPNVFVQGTVDTAKTIVYVASTDELGMPQAYIKFDASSIEGLHNYAKISSQLASDLIKQGVENLYVKVTFNRALTTEEFANLVKTNGLDVKQYYIRILGKDGSRITMFVNPREGAGQLFNAEAFKQSFDRIQEHETNQAVLSGVFEVSGVIPASAYANLVADQRVFIADVTGSLAFNNPEFASKVPLSWNDYSNQLQIAVSDVAFWTMENMGLEKFAKPVATP